jgi:hypothetical protein
MLSEVTAGKAADTATRSCRLCGGTAIRQFRLALLEKYDVDFSRCSQCESLQTDEPFWLNEAYADQRRFFDTGAVSRNQTLLMYMWYVTRLFGFGDRTTVLDWGGGDGLLTRMMRDVGIDAYHFDKYATNRYAAGFDDALDRRYDIVTAFEVWEHLPNPAEAIEEIFSRKPAVHFLTTELYTGQGSDWGYIWPTTGRHIFFFSPKAMTFIAQKYGYSLLSVGRYTLFTRRALSPVRRWLLTRLLSGKDRSLFHGYFAYHKRGASLVESDRLHMLQTRG